MPSQAPKVPTPIIDPRLRADVRAAESCKLTAYKDTRGFWTIGWGHLLPLAHDWTGLVWTMATADAQLDHDLADAIVISSNLPEWQVCNLVRENALSELIFNMGLQHWQGFLKCRAAWKRGDWFNAADELLDSAWAAEVGSRRANRIAGYVRNGVYEGVK